MSSMRNGAAVASSFADAATRFSWMDTSEGNDSLHHIESQPLGGSYHKRSSRDLSGHSSHSRHGTYATDRSTLSGSSHGHSMIEMDPAECLAALENCMVTAPNGAAANAAANSGDGFPVEWNTSVSEEDTYNYYQPHAPPKAIVTRRRASMSEMSTTSSITDFELRPAGSERQDPMMDAIREKLSSVLFKDGRQTDVNLADEVVEALASLVLSAPKKTTRRSNLSTTLEDQPLEEMRGSSHSRKARTSREHRGGMASSLAPNNSNVSPKRSRAGAAAAAGGTITRPRRVTSSASCASATSTASNAHHKQKRRNSLARRFEKDSVESTTGLDVSSTISPTDVRNVPQQRTNRRGSMNGSTLTKNHRGGGSDQHEMASTPTRRPRRSSVTTSSTSEVMSTSSMQEPAPVRKGRGRRNSMFGSSTTGDHTVPTDRELLARGWKKAMDVGSGRYYYYSLDHSRVVWENPLMMPSSSSSSLPASRKAPSWNQVGSIWDNPGSLPEGENDDDDDPFGVDPFEARF